MKNLDKIYEYIPMLLKENWIRLFILLIIPSCKSVTTGCIRNLDAILKKHILCFWSRYSRLMIYFSVSGTQNARHSDTFFHVCNLYTTYLYGRYCFIIYLQVFMTYRFHLNVMCTLRALIQTSTVLLLSFKPPLSTQTRRTAYQRRPNRSVEKTQPSIDFPTSCLSRRLRLNWCRN